MGVKAQGLRSRVRPDRILAVILEVLAAIRAEGQLADRTLSRVLRRERGLWSAERRAVAEAVYRLLRQDRLVETVLDRALGELRVPRATLSATRLDVLRLAVAAAFAGDAPPPGELPGRVAERAAALRGSVLEGEEDPWERIAVETSLPGWFVTRFGGRLGAAETAALASALNRRAPLTVRANLLRTAAGELGERLAAEGARPAACRYSPWGLVLPAHVNAFGLRAFHDGLFEVQDEGSQLIALACGVPPGRRVVDGCAGAGGKSLALAAAMGNRGEIWALDAREDRLAMLRPRAARAGADNIRCVAIAEGGPLPPAIDRLSGKADLLLVDAPCSGTGSLRRNPDARRRLSEEAIADHAARQLAILQRLSPLVRPGGRLVYATCSLLWEENEEVVARFLALSGDFAVAPWREVLGPDLSAALDEPLAGGPAMLRSELGLRLWPQRHGTDGFYAAVLAKR